MSRSWGVARPGLFSARPLNSRQSTSSDVTFVVFQIAGLKSSTTSRMHMYVCMHQCTYVYVWLRIVELVGVKVCESGRNLGQWGVSSLGLCYWQVLWRMCQICSIYYNTKFKVLSMTLFWVGSDIDEGRGCLFWFIAESCRVWIAMYM